MTSSADPQERAGATVQEHRHRWVADQSQAGQTCMDCDLGFGDWSHDTVRALRAQLAERDAWLEAMRGAVELAIAFHGADTEVFVARYGHGMTTRQLCDRLRAALNPPGPHHAVDAHTEGNDAL